MPGGHRTEDDPQENHRHSGDDVNHACQSRIVNHRRHRLDRHTPGDRIRKAQHQQRYSCAGNEQPDLRHDAEVEHTAVTDVVEPESIDVDIDADIEQDEQHQQGDAGDDDAWPGAVVLRWLALGSGVWRRLVGASAAASAESLAEDRRRRTKFAGATFV